MIRRILKSFNDGTYLVEYEDRDSAVLPLTEDQVNAFTLKDEMSEMFPHLDFEIDELNGLTWQNREIRCTAERTNALKVLALAEFHSCNDYNYFYANYLFS